MISQIKSRFDFSLFVAFLPNFLLMIVLTSIVPGLIHLPTWWLGIFVAVCWPCGVVSVSLPPGDCQDAPQVCECSLLTGRQWCLCHCSRRGTVEPSLNAYWWVCLCHTSKQWGPGQPLLPTESERKNALVALFVLHSTRLRLPPFSGRKCGRKCYSSGV